MGHVEEDWQGEEEQVEVVEEAEVMATAEAAMGLVDMATAAAVAMALERQEGEEVELAKVGVA